MALSSSACVAIDLLEIHDPPDAFPNYSVRSREKIEANRQLLRDAQVPFRSKVTQLLIEEDALLELLTDSALLRQADTVVLDISSLPKRYFCFLLKRMVLFEPFTNIIVTYTQPAPGGYTSDHLAEDPMTCDHLPGFAAPLPPKGSTLAVALGFEVLSLRSLLEIYRDKTKETRIILSFPADVQTTRREWNTLAEMTSGDSADVEPKNLEVIATWDSEAVYNALLRWNEDTDGLTLAPFGAKPHSLAMTLFAMKHDCGLYYTQPKSYHPDYSRGVGSTWAYVVKWSGVPCFDRRMIAV